MNPVASWNKNALGEVTVGGREVEGVIPGIG